MSWLRGCIATTIRALGGGGGGSLYILMWITNVLKKILLSSCDPLRLCNDRDNRL